MFRYIVFPGIFVIFILISCLCVTAAFCDQGKPAEPSGVELITDLLKAKGVISPDEAAALKAKTSGGESQESLKALVDLLKNKGLVSDSEADRLNQTLVKTTPASQAAAKAILVVPRDQEYVQKITDSVATEVKKDIHDQVQTEVAQQADKTIQDRLKTALPDWMQNWRFSGDMRLRYEQDIFPRGNGSVLDPNTPTQLLNTTENVQEERIRFRLKVEADVNPETMVGARITTGNNTNPVSSNTTFGDYYVKSGFLLDQAYLRYKPFDGFSAWAGRIPNPWFSTDLIWSNDLNFEGVAANYKREVGCGLTPFITGGAFPLQQVGFSGSDKWLFGGQGGFEYKRDKEFSFMFGVAYYDYEHITGMENPPGQTIYDYTAPLFMQKGNTVFNIEPPAGGVAAKYALAAQFRDLDFTANWDFAYWDPIHIILLGDYIKNVSFDAQQVSLLSGRPTSQMQDTAYKAGVLVGYPNPRRFLQWNVSAYYKYVGTDSVLDAFDDPDFHLGGTNAKGWILGGELGLMKNVWLTARWLTADQISPFQNSKGGPFSVDVFQLDTNASF